MQGRATRRRTRSVNMDALAESLHACLHSHKFSAYWPKEYITSVLRGHGTWEDCRYAISLFAVDRSLSYMLEMNQIYSSNFDQNDHEKKIPCVECCQYSRDRWERGLSLCKVFDFAQINLHW